MSYFASRKKKGCESLCENSICTTVACYREHKLPPWTVDTKHTDVCAIFDIVWFRLLTTLAVACAICPFFFCLFDAYMPSASARVKEQHVRAGSRELLKQQRQQRDSNVSKCYKHTGVCSVGGAKPGAGDLQRQFCPSLGRGTDQPPRSLIPGRRRTARRPGCSPPPPVVAKL